MADDDSGARKPQTVTIHVIGEPLDRLSVAEFGERIAQLQVEIARLEVARTAKQASRDAAAAFFKA